MNKVDSLAQELELVQQDLARLHRRVDSVLVSMKEQSLSVDSMVMTLRNIIGIDY